MKENKAENPVKPEVKQETAPEAQPGSVKVTKGGISKIVSPSQAATYKANGWT
jgi:hypothetical protein